MTEATHLVSIKTLASAHVHEKVGGDIEQADVDHNFVTSKSRAQ